ncbi:MAG: hypothetical protein MUO29_07225 [Desulfobacterales bacterium]|nr:hypothetical protein [Desulfobacterales bacterium]
MRPHLPALETGSLLGQKLPVSKVTGDAAACRWQGEAGNTAYDHRRLLGAAEGLAFIVASVTRE